MDLRGLRYFIAVAEDLHFTKAARRLGITQPPLSRQIRLLEEALGVTLLARLGKRVKLTPAGEAFYPEARRVLEQADCAIEAARRAAPQLRAGHVPGNALMIVSRAQELMAERFRHHEVQVTEHMSHDLMRRVLSGELHVAFISKPLPGSPLYGLEYEPLVHCRPRVCLPATHRLAADSAIELNRLNGEGLVVYSKNRDLYHRPWSERCAASRGFTPASVVEVSTVTALVTAVAAGSGVGFVLSAYEAWVGPQVVLRPFSPDGNAIEFGLVIGPHAPRPATAAWLSALREARYGLPGTYPVEG